MCSLPAVLGQVGARGSSPGKEARQLGVEALEAEEERSRESAVQSLTLAMDRTKETLFGFRP